MSGMQPGEHACVVTADGTIVAVTPELPGLLGVHATELLGGNARDLLGASASDCSDPDAGETCAPKLVDLLIGGGQIVTHIVDRWTLLDHEGQLVQLIKITPAKADVAVDLDSEAVIFGVSEDLRIVSWTAGAEQLTGVTRQHALNRPCWEILGFTELDGTPTCGPDCRLAHALRATSELPTARVRMNASSNHAAVDLNMTVIQIGGRSVLIHRIPNQTRGAAHRHQTTLTPRQLEVLKLLGDGLTTDAIAHRLVIETVTAKNHIQRVLQALGCHSRVEAIAKARRQGLI